MASRHPKVLSPPPASSEAVSKSMRSNKRKDTKPELALRKALRDAGLTGYRLQWKVPGHPDIAYPGRKVAVFVNGCFWHRCPKCDLSLPKSHLDYWIPKLEKNVERDAEKTKALESRGWIVVTVWECEIRKDTPRCVERVRDAIHSRRSDNVRDRWFDIRAMDRGPDMPGEKITVVELFAGVGGFRAGLEQASDVFETIWANQWEPGRKDQFAFRCYDSHFSDTSSKNVNEDIDLVWRDVPKCDLLVGGFPCQDYSVASTKAKGIEGKKGVLWWNIRDIIHRRKPKYVLLENVDRLLKSPVNRRGRDFGIILRCLADENYYVEWRVVNAADYGFQQKRRRVFVFACRKALPFAKRMAKSKGSMEGIVAADGFFARRFPVDKNPIAGESNAFSVSKERYATLVDLSNRMVEPLYSAGVMVGYEAYTRNVVSRYKGRRKKTLGELLVEDVDSKYYVDGGALDGWKFMKGSKRLVRKHRDGNRYIYSEGAIPFPDRLDTPGRTMLTSEGRPNRSSHIIWDERAGRYRTLTPVECERLNGFPDGWTDTGMSDAQRYFCMGNALVVDLIAVMGKQILVVDKENAPQEKQSRKSS